MKEGWEYKKLGEVCEILNGFAFKSSRYVSEGIRVIRISNVQKGRVEDNDPKFYPLSSKCEIERYLLREGDLLISLTGNVGRVGRLPQELLPAALNQRVACLRLKGKEINKQYLYHFLNSDYFVIKCTKNSSGVAQLNLSTAWLSNYKIAIPPFSEQQSIVDYLDSAFAKIDAMKANAEKALNEAKALFQASLKEMLEPKEGWEEKALGELSDKIGDGLHGTPKYTDDGEYFFVNGNNLENGIIEIKDNTKRVNHDEYEKYKLDLNSSTVLLSINGTIGKTAFYNGEPIILGKSACYINVLPALLKEYLRYYLVSDGFFNYVKSNSRQATITNLGLKEIRKMPLPTPSLDEQQSIVETLDSLKSKVDRLQANYDKISQECDALKQAILRQVFE